MSGTPGAPTSKLPIQKTLHRVKFQNATFGEPSATPRLPYLSGSRPPFRLRAAAVGCGRNPTKRRRKRVSAPRTTNRPFAPRGKILLSSAKSVARRPPRCRPDSWAALSAIRPRNRFAQKAPGTPGTCSQIFTPRLQSRPQTYREAR